MYLLKLSDHDRCQQRDDAIQMKTILYEDDSTWLGDQSGVSSNSVTFSVLSGTCQGNAISLFF